MLLQKRVAQWVKVFYSEFKGLLVQFLPDPWLGYGTEPCYEVPVNFLPSKKYEQLKYL